MHGKKFTWECTNNGAPRTILSYAKKHRQTDGTLIIKKRCLVLLIIGSQKKTKKSAPWTFFHDVIPQCSDTHQTVRMDELHVHLVHVNPLPLVSHPSFALRNPDRRWLRNELSHPMRIHVAIKNSAFCCVLVPLHPLRSGNCLIPPALTVPSPPLSSPFVILSKARSFSVLFTISLLIILRGKRWVMCALFIYHLLHSSLFGLYFFYTVYCILPYLISA